MDPGPVERWTISEVSNWLTSVDLATLAPTFEAQEIDGLALLDLNASDLDSLGIKLGPRKKLEIKTKMLKSQRTEKVVQKTILAKKEGNKFLYRKNFLFCFSFVHFFYFSSFSFLLFFFFLFLFQKSFSIFSIRCVKENK